MNAVSHPLDAERELTDGYAEQARLYGLALAALAPRPAALGDDAPFRRLKDLMEQVAQVERRLAPAKRRWEELRRRPGAQLAAALDRLRELLHGLITATSDVEKSARAEREQLGLSADAAVQGQKMRQAYAAVKNA